MSLQLKFVSVQAGVLNTETGRISKHSWKEFQVVDDRLGIVTHFGEAQSLLAHQTFQFLQTLAPNDLVIMQDKLQRRGKYDTLEITELELAV